MAQNNENIGREISVQELIKNPFVEIPQKYITDQEPAIFSDKTAVPIVDMKRYLFHQTKASELENFHSACKEWGIFQVLSFLGNFQQLQFIYIQQLP